MSTIFRRAGEPLKAGDMVYIKRILVYKMKDPQDAHVGGICKKDVKKGDTAQVQIYGVYKFTEDEE